MERRPIASTEARQIQVGERATDSERRYVRDGKDVSYEDAIENGYDDKKWRKKATHA